MPSWASEPNGSMIAAVLASPGAHPPWKSFTIDHTYPELSIFLDQNGYFTLSQSGRSALKGVDCVLELLGPGCAALVRAQDSDDACVPLW